MLVGRRQTGSHCGWRRGNVGDEGRIAAARAGTKVPIHDVHGIVERGIKLGQEMAVRIERDRDGAMSHPLHDRPGVSALGDEHRGVAVPQVVEARAPR